MTHDKFILAVDKEHHLTGGIAITTQSCRIAKERHTLQSTSCVALGRLLTAAALTSLVKRDGDLSLQIVCQGRLGQIYADVTADGNLRGYVKNPSFALPHSAAAGKRHEISPAVGEGVLSAIRMGDDREFQQSTTALVSGEIDSDVEHFLSHSDQVPTAMVCDVLLDDKEDVAIAGGIVLQAMPGAAPDALKKFSGGFPDYDFATALGEQDPATIIKHVLPNATLVATQLPLRWQCRCSYERVVSALHMAGANELAEMVDEKSAATVHCDFCQQEYTVPPDAIEQIFLDTITAKG